MLHCSREENVRQFLSLYYGYGSETIVKEAIYVAYRFRLLLFFIMSAPNCNPPHCIPRYYVSIARQPDSKINKNRMTIDRAVERSRRFLEAYAGSVASQEKYHRSLSWLNTFLLLELTSGLADMLYYLGTKKSIIHTACFFVCHRGLFFSSARRHFMSFMMRGLWSPRFPDIDKRWKGLRCLQVGHLMSIDPYIFGFQLKLLHGNRQPQARVSELNRPSKYISET
jgi:hypothetical protein